MPNKKEFTEKEKSEIYDKLKNINKISAETELSENEVEKILKLRAEKLARKKAKEKNVNEIEIIEFQLANEIYGIETQFLKEVLLMKDLTMLPQTPAFVKGIINLRGEIISVIDLKNFFELPQKSIPGLEKILILKDEEMTFGISADNVYGVKKVSMENSQTRLPNLNDIREKYLRAVTKDLTIILDGKKILNDEKIIIDDKI